MKKENKPYNIHAGHRTRLRNFANENGISNMPQHQALELLLSYVIPQKDTNPIAHDLMNEFGSFSAVLDAKPEDLIKVKGVGSKTADFISEIKEFFYLYKKSKLNKIIKINNTRDVFFFVSELIGDKPYEEILLVVVDGNNYVKHYETISKGVSNATSLNLRNLLQIVFKHNASNVIIAHNHPSGSAKPSTADDKLTKLVLTSLTLNGINLLDHMIVGTTNYYSYFIDGKIKQWLDESVKIGTESVAMQKKCSYEAEADYGKF